MGMYSFENCTSCCGGCSYCETNSPGSQVQITVANIANDLCSNCTDFNGVWVLEQDPDDSCKWIYCDETTISCSGSEYEVCLWFRITATGADIQMFFSGDAGPNWFSSTIETDCSLYEGLHTDTSPGLPYCDGSTVTFDVVYL